MNDFVILIDSSGDLNKAQREKYGVADYIPGTVTYPDGNQYNADLDWERTTPEEFYRELKETKGRFSTGTPSPAMIEEKCKKYLEQGKDVLLLILSSGLSSSYSVAYMVAKELNEAYKDNKVVVVDTLRYSGAIALLAKKAGELRSEGFDIDRTAEWLNENKCRIHQIGPMDDLMYLKRMGRVPAMAAVMGTLISIKPMADFDPTGISHVITKVKGYKNGLRASVKYVKELAIPEENETIFISNSVMRSEAQYLADMIKEELNPKHIEMMTIGQLSGVSIGPGLVAVYFWGEPIKEGLEKEKAVMAQILKK